MPELNIHDRALVPAAVAFARGSARCGCSRCWPSTAHEEHGHPTRIHEGTCEALGPVAVRSMGLGAVSMSTTRRSPRPRRSIPDSAYQVLISETTIDGTIEELLPRARGDDLRATRRWMRSPAVMSAVR